VKLKLTHVVAGGAAIAVLGLVGCEDANQKDVRGVQANANPGNVTVFANIDQHPNFTRICADGLAFITTSRDTMPINRLPEWDWACPKPPGFQPSKGEPTNLLGGHITVVHQDAG
jgi:hypothetical protein